MSKQLDRARARHQELVKYHHRLRDKHEKEIRAMVRTRAKLDASERAIARSGRRLDKLVAAATHTNGPTASVAEQLVAQVADKPPAAAKLNDPVPSFEGRAAKSVIAASN